MSTVTTDEARKNFSKLIELAFYKNQLTRVKRNKTPMAWIVGEPFMQRLGQFVDYLIEHEPALADTLAITLDDDIREAIETGTKEVKDGKLIPIRNILDD